MFVLAEHRAGLDVEHRASAEREVARLADEAERDPVTKAELFSIALSRRLDNLKLELEEGDENEASLLDLAPGRHSLMTGVRSGFALSPNVPSSEARVFGLRRPWRAGIASGVQ